MDKRESCQVTSKLLVEPDETILSQTSCYNNNNPDDKSFRDSLLNLFTWTSEPDVGNYIFKRQATFKSQMWYILGK